jgi:hypothetical protein
MKKLWTGHRSKYPRTDNVDASPSVTLTLKLGMCVLRTTRRLIVKICATCFQSPLIGEKVMNWKQNITDNIPY